MAIDLTKGIAYTPPPKHWSKRQKYIPIPDNASLELKEEIEKQNEEIKFNNSICCNKKTYFFGYVYPAKMVEYRKHKKKYDKICRSKFKMSISDLIRVTNKTQSQKKLIKEYYKYSPLFNSKCTMNLLCKMIEDMDYEYKRTTHKGNVDYKIMMNNDATSLSEEKIEKFQRLVHEHIKISAKLISNLSDIEDFSGDSGFDDIRAETFDSLYEDFIRDCHEVEQDGKIITDYLVHICYAKNNSAAKQLVWHCFGEEIVKNVKKNSKHRYSIIENPRGTEHFGRRFSIVDDYKQEDNPDVI